MSSSPNSSGMTLYLFVTGSGRPALGFMITGRFVTEHSFSTAG